MTDLSMVCTRHVETPARARAWVADRFEEQVERIVLEAVQLIVTELVTNAIVHGTGEITLCVALEARQLRVEVEDSAVDCQVVIIPLAVDGPAGRGLRLVEAFSTRWGCDVVADRKTVWAEIDL